jgi:hypothetical protein
VGRILDTLQSQSINVVLLTDGLCSSGDDMRWVGGGAVSGWQSGGCAVVGGVKRPVEIWDF